MKVGYADNSVWSYKDVQRTYGTGKLVWKCLMVVVVLNNPNMFEGRRVGVGRKSVAVTLKKIWSIVPLHPEGLHQELTQMKRLALRKRKFTSPARSNDGILAFTTGCEKKNDQNKRSSLSQ